MAMYPSKKKPTGNADLGTFTTNGQVTNQNVSGKATASFTINVPATVHTQTYTPATNKSNNDMGSTHTYRYVNTSGMITPSGTKSITANGTGIDVSSYSKVDVAVPEPSATDITPSSTPIELTDGVIYKAHKRVPSTVSDTAGYAIESYSSVTPSDSSPVSLTSGNFYKMSGAGKAVASVTDVTPSSSGAAFSAGITKMSSAGYAYSSRPSGTSITPSDSSPAAMTSGGMYTPTKAGYAIESNPTSVTPSASGASFSAGITKMTAAGYAYSSKPTGTSITPSDSSPVAMAKDSTYTPTKAGYAIESNPTSLAPSDSSPAAITSGTIYKATDNGYAVASSPTNIIPDTSGVSFSPGVLYTPYAGYAYTRKPSKTTTQLWTNSSPTSSFGSKDVTGLSSDISNFDYIRITYRNSTSDSTSQSTTFAVSELPDSNGRATIGKMVGSSTRFRPIYKSSNTSIYFYASYTTGSTTSSNTYIIPTKIEGIKYNGIS